MSENACLPIDIHCGKLLEWLQSRRHCGKDWQQSVFQIREKISHAIQDMPENEEILEMLAGAYINYFHCQKIVEILKQTDSSSKNIFGRYSSQRVKDWLEVVQMYEKNNVYLAESAQLLQQYAQYEIPALKKQLAKCQNTEQECERKEIEYEKLSKEFEKKFRQNCQKMGINNENLKSELLKLADSLPEKFEKIVKNLKNVKFIVDYYEKFRNFILFGKNYKQKIVENSEKDDFSNKNLLPNLKFIQNFGNVTVYQWKNGHPPDSIERVLLHGTAEENKSAEDNEKIDFGDEIDFGNDENIDFSIENVETGATLIEPSEEKSIIDQKSKDKVARFEDALTLLESSEFLKALNCDLKELQAFLAIRLMELKKSGMDQYGNIDLYDLNETFEEIESQKLSIDQLLIDFRDENLKNLRKLRVSPPYLEKLIEILQESRRKSNKFRQLIVLSRDQAEKARKKSIDVRQQIDLLIVRAKELQKRIEIDISKRYQDRPVNIIGSTVAV